MGQLACRTTATSVARSDRSVTVSRIRPPSRPMAVRPAGRSFSRVPCPRASQARCRREREGRFRAGIERRIHVLRRDYCWKRCRYYGERGMGRWVDWGIVVHNLARIDEAQGPGELGRMLVGPLGERAGDVLPLDPHHVGQLHSRAGLGWREIRWRPAVVFSAGAVPASVLGSRLFVVLPSVVILRSIGVFLLVVVALRHTTVGKRPFPERMLAPAGVVVGLLSAIAGSAGPLGVAVFLGLKLPPRAYVASEAVTAVFMHTAKSLVYGRYAALTSADLSCGLAGTGSSHDPRLMDWEEVGRSAAGAGF
jgi:hypothetical protein